MLGMWGYSALALDVWLNYWIIILTKDGEGRDDDTEKGVSADVVRHKRFEFLFLLLQFLHILKIKWEGILS